MYCWLLLLLPLLLAAYCYCCCCGACLLKGVTAVRCSNGQSVAKAYESKIHTGLGRLYGNWIMNLFATIITLHHIYKCVQSDLNTKPIKTSSRCTQFADQSFTIYHSFFPVLDTWIMKAAVRVPARLKPSHIRMLNRSRVKSSKTTNQSVFTFFRHLS